MRVVIKEDQSIPEGYTLIKCDEYTADDFVKTCSPRVSSRWVNLNALEYVRDHPKPSYNAEDVRIVQSMSPLRLGKPSDIEARHKGGEASEAAKRKRMQNRPAAQRMPQDVRDGPVLPRDLSTQEAARRFALSEVTIGYMMRECGMPFRRAGSRRQGNFLRLPEVLEYLERLKLPSPAQVKMIKHIRAFGMEVQR